MTGIKKVVLSAVENFIRRLDMLLESAANAAKSPLDPIWLEDFGALLNAATDSLLQLDDKDFSEKWKTAVNSGRRRAKFLAKMMHDIPGCEQAPGLTMVPADQWPESHPCKKDYNWLKDLVQQLHTRLPDSPAVIRIDEPDEAEMDAGRQVCQKNPWIKRDELAAQLKIGKTKASKILIQCRNEGIAKSRSRKPPRLK